MGVYSLICKIIIKMRSMGWCVPDSFFIPAFYYLKVGERLNVKKPKTFNEKMQWLKLHDHNVKYHDLVDKLSVKDFVADTIGEQYVIKTLAAWDSIDKIDISCLPNQFVLKTTNGGGGTGVVICKDKKTFDLEEAKKKLQWSANYDIYQQMGEWVYKGIKPRYFAEELLVIEPSKSFLKDYKWYCVNGDPKYCQVTQDHDSNKTTNFFDTEWTPQNFNGLKSAAIPAVRPRNLNEQIEIAKCLARNIPFARIDLYEVNSHTFWGGITSFATSDIGTISSDNFNFIIGKMIDLPGEQINWGKIEVDDKNEFKVSPIDIPDFKIWCFNGEPKILFYASNRFNKEKNPPYFDYYDMTLKKLPIRSRGHQNSDSELIPFKEFELMKHLAGILSKGIPFVRVDFYLINGCVFFGEMTFYHDSGFVPFIPEEWNTIFGDYLALPIK